MSSAVDHRRARIERKTSESHVVVEVDLDGTGAHEISTGVGFYDHMLTALSRHSLVDLTVEAVAICIGQGFAEALGDKSGIRRFGDAMVHLDEALAQAVVDVSGRPYCVHTGEPESQITAVIGGDYMGSLTAHVFESFAHHAGIGLHVRLLAGRDPHP